MQLSSNLKNILVLLTGGTWINPALGMKSDRDVLKFLALEVYFEAAGCRFDVVRRLSVAYINNATRLPKECPYCKEKTTHLKAHKKECRKRRKAIKRGDIKKEENYVYDYVVNIHKHKTSDSSTKGLVLVISNRLMSILELWVATKHNNRNGDAIFGSIKW